MLFRPVIVLALLFYTISASAQTNKQADDSVRYNCTLKETKITARWLNDTDRYHYNQMKFYVTTVLPYVNAATKLFKEVNAKINEPGLSKRDRKQYISEREDQIRTEFEDKVKSLNTTQGVLLIKLIARQTDINIYKTLQEFKNPLTAVKWQMWARVNGLNLDRRYHPEEERDLENIMDELGYPLPASYASNPD